VVEHAHLWAAPAGAVLVVALGFALLRLRGRPVESEV
jgi:hypothetical protein